MRVCNTPGCGTLTTTPKCPTHTKQADKARGTATQRGYTTKGHTKHFRPQVLTRDPICVLCHLKQSTIADHHPHSRKELIELGQNPNDPQHGRGLCNTCHNRETATNQPGGWHTPDGWGDTP